MLKIKVKHLFRFLLERKHYKTEAEYIDRKSSDVSRKNFARLESIESSSPDQSEQKGFIIIFIF